MTPEVVSFCPLVRQMDRPKGKDGTEEPGHHCSISPPGHPVLPVFFTWALSLGISLGLILWPRVQKKGGMERWWAQGAGTSGTD